MIDPTAVSTIRVGELPSAPFNLTDNLPHEVGVDLKKGTIEELSTFISAYIGATDAVGFRAISVTDGQTLPTTTKEEFILVGKGTFYNVAGGSTIVCTEELNAIVSNGSFWFIGVEIPVNIELSGVTQFIRQGFTDTTPSEDAVYGALALKVPYTGATTNVSLGEFQLSAGQITFDQTPTQSAGVGVLRWNDTDGTLDLGLKGGNVTLQLGQEQIVRVVNKTGSNLTESGYQAVYTSGAQGQRLKVDLALANSDLTSAGTLGLITENILVNQEGFVTTNGLVRGINTTGSLQSETWADGDILYLSPITAGKLTNIKPVAPQHSVTIGVCVYAHITQGAIFVKVDNGYELEELHNVLINTAINNDALIYESATGLWKNKTISSALGYTPENIANKSDSFILSSSTTYASTKALVDGLGVSQKDIAYVDINGNNSTAILGNIRKPFLTIDAALDALPATGGVVKIGIGSFLSPAPAKIKAYTSFVGQGKPVTNSVITYTTIGVKPTVTSPTKLVGGTILLGKVEVSLKDGVEFHNLGVDSGLDYCNAYASGVAQEGLIFAQQYNIAGGLPSDDGMHQLQTNSPPRTGCVINNVSVLCKSSTSAVHAMLVENTLNAKVSNVSTYYGIHGLVIKSIGATVNGFDCQGHDNNALIIKANDYAYCYGNSITNGIITSLSTNDTQGINFVAGNIGFSPSLNNLSNIDVIDTRTGVFNDGITDGNNISNMSIYRTSGIGLDIDSDFLNSTFSNIDQRQGTTGFLVSHTGVSVSGNSHFVNCKSSNNSVKGWDLNATGNNGIYVSNCYGTNDGVGSSVSGNSYGFVNESATLTGTFKYDTSGVTEVLSTINANGKTNKSTVQLSTLLTGSGITNFVPKFTSTNTIGASTISETSALTTIPILSNTGELVLVANPSIIDGVSRIELSGQANANPNKIYIRGDAISFTAAGATLGYGIISSSGLRLNSLSGTGTRTVVADASGNLSTTVGYKVYTALLTQSGTSAPTETVLENTLGAAIVWSRSGTGNYLGTLGSAFPANKTFVIVGRSYTDAAANYTIAGGSRGTNDWVSISTNGLDGQLSLTNIEIRVYN